MSMTNIINVPQPGVPQQRFQSDTAKAIGRIRDALGPSGLPNFESITLLGLTASRLVATDADKTLESIDLVNWVAGTADEITVADDGTGGVVVGISDPLIVGKGGTGVATLADHSILLGSGTSAVTPLGVATDGQLPVGSTGVDPVLATVTGTADEIAVVNGAGSITLSLDGSIGDIAGLTPDDGNFIVGDSVNWVAESGNTARTSLGLGTGDSPQFTRLGVGAAADGTIPVLVTGAAFPIVRAIRETASTATLQAAFDLVAKSTGNMADGLGGGLAFSVQDDSAGPTIMSALYGVRWGADNTGGLRVRVNNAGTLSSSTWFDPSGKVFIGTGVKTPLATLEVSGDARFGGTTNFTQFADDGELTLEGTARVIKERVLNISDLSPGASGTTTVVVGNYVVAEFGIADDVVSDFEMPHDWDSTTDIEIEIVWQINEAYVTNSGEVQWRVQWSACPSNESESITAPTHTGTIDYGDQNIPATARYLTSSTGTIVASSLSAGDTVGLTLDRVTLDGGTNPAVEPGVTYVKIHYTANKLGEAT